MSSSASTTLSNRPPSLLHTVLTAYLEPLLKKHAEAKLAATSTSTPTTPSSASCIITYEDLMASWDAAVAVWRSTSSTPSSASTVSADAEMASRNNKTAVHERLKALHASQLTAYTKAAQQALESWSQTVPLPELNRQLHDSVSAYQKSCRAVTAATRPLWRDVNSAGSSSTSESSAGPTSIVTAALERIDARAAELFQMTTGAASGSTASMTEEGEMDEGDAITGGTNEGVDEEGEVEEGEQAGIAISETPAVATTTMTASATSTAAAVDASTTASGTSGNTKKAPKKGPVVKKKTTIKPKVGGAAGATAAGTMSNANSAGAAGVAATNSIVNRATRPRGGGRGGGGGGMGGATARGGRGGSGSGGGGGIGGTSK